VARPCEQRHDARSTSQSGSFITRICPPSGRFQDPSGRLVPLYISSLEPKAVYVCFLCAVNVSESFLAKSIHETKSFRDGLTHMKIRIQIGYALIAATYVATLLSILLGCRPMHKNWQINPDPGNLCQPAISKIDCLVTVVLNVVTDMYLISIPLPVSPLNHLIRRQTLTFNSFYGQPKYL